MMESSIWKNYIKLHYITLTMDENCEYSDHAYKVCTGVFKIK